MRIRALQRVEKYHLHLLSLGYCQGKVEVFELYALPPV